MTFFTLWLATLAASAEAATLSTTSAGGNASNGAMFDVYATNALTISSIRSYSYSATSGCSYLIYYTTSTLSSVLTTSSAWTLVASGTHSATSAGGAWDASLSTPITVSAGSRIALYITYTSCSLQYTTTSSLGSVYASNSDMSIYEGYGRSYSSTFGGSSFSPRTWNGTITYSTCSTSTYYADDDSDGYGDASSTTSACARPSGYVNNSRDCDDTDSSVYPGATEYCDGEDDDCDGTTDEATAVDASTWYRDSDSDGYGRSSSTKVACDLPSGYVANSTDCDDTDSGVYPGSTEYCDGEDDDCDGTTDEASAVDADTWYLDDDSDGYGDPSVTSTACSAPSGYVAAGTDCDDTDANVSPGDTESCNGVDDDCDGTTDESSASDAGTWYVDADSDGYGASAGSTRSCTAPAGYTATAGDCDDGDGAEYPGASERCDGDDDDCDGTTDESSAVDAATWYRDADTDGYGVSGTTTVSCTAPSGYVALATDCDDTDVAEFPGAAEYCDGDDDNCDGAVDESTAVDAAAWYPDDDTDGYGDATRGIADCGAPAGHVADASDCDDGDAAEYPGATEYCDGDDDDCDGSADEPDAVDASTWYADADADGYGDAASSTPACDEPAGYTADATDCDDGDVDTYPAAPETPYDGVDQDCSGDDLCDVDEDGQDALACAGDDCDDEDPGAYLGAVETWYDGADEACDGGDDYDADADGYTSATYGGDDCDDAVATTYPGAPDTPYDGEVSDCDAADEYDADGDGHDAESEGGDDCDDANSATYPGAAEVWYDGLDGDCSGGSDFDADADGWESADHGGADCDDTDNDVWPGAPDDPYDGVIEDCDASDEYDADGDGHDAVAFGGADCDDEDADIHPGAEEEPADGVDADCDSGELCFADADDDGQTAEDPQLVASADLDCDDTGEATADDSATDCDDAAATSHFGAPEVCDGVDNSCNYVVDEGCDDEPADTGEKVDEAPTGCGCSTPGPGAASAAGVLAAALWARRRRSA